MSVKILVYFMYIASKTEYQAAVSFTEFLFHIITKSIILRSVSTVTLDWLENNHYTCKWLLISSEEIMDLNPETDIWHWAPLADG
jgi:hypothetical protein